MSLFHYISLFNLVHNIYDSYVFGVIGCSSYYIKYNSCFSNGHIKVTQLLLSKSGIDMNKAVGEGSTSMTALRAAAMAGHAPCVQLLLSMSDIDIHQADTHGNTPLLYEAAKHGHVDVVRLLL